VAKYGVEEETKNLLTYLNSDDWTTVAELDSNQEFNQKLAQAIDPLTQKVMGASGEVLVDQMPIQMTQWIRDSTSLWIKNKGAGTPTTEAAVTNEDSQAQIAQIKAAYENKVSTLERKL